MKTRRHTRRDFLRAVGVGAAAISAPRLLRGAPAASRRDRPNILFIMVDDLGKEWVSCCGAEDIQTANLDALAAGGMRFTNAYSMPQCTPTRVTLLTGQYPWRTGWVNHWDVPRWGVGYFDWKHHTTFARILKTAGYVTAAAGKWQINDFRVSPDAMKRHGFDEWCLWTGYETGNPPSGKRYMDAYINTPQGSRTHAGKFGPDVYTDFLIDFVRRHRDKPMCLYFPMCLTHGPLVATPDEPDAKDGPSKHKAMVRYVDKLVGRLVKALDDAGIRGETIIVFSTDNGSGGGIAGTRNGRKVKGGKAKKNEAGVCAPFIVNGPGRVPAGVVTDALTDFTDLLPTFAELGGAKVPGDLKIDGVSIAPVMLGKATDSPREWIMALGHGAARLDEKGVRGQNDFADRVIRDKRFKVWVDTNRKITHLHDLKADPWEEKNLIDSKDPPCVAALRKFQAVVDSMPAKDARPKYDPRPASPWDRKAGAVKPKKGAKEGKAKKDRAARRAAKRAKQAADGD
ncbi:MAG: sulfatase-like hydrolase/transferase [Phycisphaerae bacterium]